MNTLSQKITTFRRTIWQYYRHHGRHSMPWRHTTDPYHIMVSEIMLQQTQVDRVVPKYHQFLHRFPTFADLAAATTAQVLATWQGLGYNRRALALKRLSEIIVSQHGGHLPPTPEELVELPGIGPATASSIAAFAFNHPSPFIETNIRRVFIHFFFPKSRQSVPDEKIIKLVTRAMDAKNPREWYWAVMDYGTMLAASLPNPNRKSRHYRPQSSFEGSLRQVRGAILKKLVTYTNTSSLSIALLTTQIQQPAERIEKAITALEKEGFLLRDGDTLTLTDS